METCPYCLKHIEEILSGVHVLRPIDRNADIHYKSYNKGDVLFSDDDIAPLEVISSVELLWLIPRRSPNRVRALFRVVVFPSNKLLFLLSCKTSLISWRASVTMSSGFIVGISQHDGKNSAVFEVLVLLVCGM